MSQAAFGAVEARRRRVLPLATFATAASVPLVLYLLTMPPTITWWFGGSDSGDLASAADVLGIPHPTGYPLFVLLGHVATRVPLGEIGGRINAMNAVLAALGAGMIALTVLQVRIADSRLPSFILHPAAAVLAALAVATSSLYWSQAIIGEVYALHAALAALVLWLWARPSTPPALRGAAHGLALSNHVTSAILLAAAIAAFSRRRPSVTSARPALWFAAGLAGALSLYALLPLRAAHDPVANWGDPDTPGRFLAHITARQYRHLVDRRDIGGMLRDIPRLLRLAAGDLPPWALLIAVVGFRRLVRAQRSYAVFTALTCVGSLLFTAAYRVPDSAPYLLPAYLVVGVWSGAGLIVMAESVGARSAERGTRNSRTQPFALRVPRSALRLEAVGVVLLLVIWTARAGSRVNLRGDDSAVVFARATLAALPPGATYYSARDDVTFALWYAQRSLRIRRDVRVVDVRNPQLCGMWNADCGVRNEQDERPADPAPHVLRFALDPPARNVHARARPAHDTTLSLDNVRLSVPAGAVASGAVVGLGAGGVPAPAGEPDAAGIVVTAAGGLRAPVAILVAVSGADRAVTAGGTPALRDTATGAHSPCLDAGAWAACPVTRPGAYLVGRTRHLPAVAGDPFLVRALAGLPPAQAPARRPTALILAVVVAAALAGALAALFAGPRPPQD